MLRSTGQNLISSATKKFYKNIACKCVGNSVRKYSGNYSFPKLILDENNVVKSPIKDVTGFENRYVHEIVWNKLDSWADKTAIVCSSTKKSYTYSELRKLSGKLATSLRKCKLLPGETIAVILPNIPEYAIVTFGANEAGLRATLINPAYTSEEIKAQLVSSDACAVITIHSKYNEISRIISGNPKIKVPIILIDDRLAPTYQGTINFRDLIEDDVDEFSKSEKTGVDYESTVFAPFSSGTTGHPKGVELSHRNVAANILQMNGEGINVGVETTNTHQDIIPIILPLFHIYGLISGLYKSLWLGSKVVCVPKFSVEEFLNILVNYKPSVLYVVPPMVQMIVNDDRIKPSHFETVRTIVSGAAPLGPELISQFQNRISTKVNFLQGYGLTEASPCIIHGVIGRSSDSGYVIPNTEIRIVGCKDENRGKNLGVNESGELYARGPQIMKGYYKNPAATAETMDGDWLKTGDLASYDETGSITIQGRLKELIKVKGFQVAPAELEDILRDFDKIKDVAVIGVPHEKFGEIPKAFVVPKKGVNLLEEEVKEFLTNRVAKHKQLGHVEFMEEIPKSGSGKILRKLLENRPV